MPSKPHLALRKWLNENLPGVLYYEEYILGNGLRLDFLLPYYRLGIEVDGKQHESYNSHFFSSKREFLEAVERDIRKEHYCKEQYITLLRFPAAKVLNGECFQYILETMESNGISSDEFDDLVKVGDPVINPRTESNKEWYRKNREKLKERRQEEYRKFKENAK